MRAAVNLRSLGGKDESHVSRACASVVGLRRLPDDGSELWPGLRQPVSILWCNRVVNSCHMTTMKHAPRPDGCCEGCAESCGRGGNMRGELPGRQLLRVRPVHGSECGPQYPTGPYDCSPCNSCDWGCNGHRHPMGYKTGHECYCQNDGCNGQPNCCLSSIAAAAIAAAAGRRLQLLPVLRLRAVGRSELQLQSGAAGCSDGVSVLHAAWSAGFPAE